MDVLQLKVNAKDGPNCDVTNNNAARIIEISRQLCRPHHPQNKISFCCEKRLNCMVLLFNTFLHCYTCWLLENVSSA